MRSDDHATRSKVPSLGDSVKSQSGASEPKLESPSATVPAWIMWPLTVAVRNVEHGASIARASASVRANCQVVIEPEPSSQTTVTMYGPCASSSNVVGDFSARACHAPSAPARNATSAGAAVVSIVTGPDA